MSNLITFPARQKLWEQLYYDLFRFYTSKIGSFTFNEFLDFREKLRTDAVERHKKNGKDRIPHYIWERFRGASDVILRLIEKDLEGGYLIFGKFYRHPGRNTVFPEAKSWQDLCPEDPSFRQKLLKDNYVFVWKNTGTIYSGKKPHNQELPYMCFYVKGGVLYFRMKKDNVSYNGSEPVDNGQVAKYKAIMKIMDFYHIPMENVEEV